MKIDLTGKGFGGRPVLGPIRADIAPGERVALLGRSGIGKSTLIRILAGLDTDIDGTVTGIGRVAIVFQEPTLLPWRTAVDNITLPTRCTPGLALRLLGEVGLEGRQNAYPRQLSLGQQRRLALARALAAEPDILLLDEAFASLDTETRERMLGLTETLLASRSVGLILATHDLVEAQRLCTRALVLANTPATLAIDHNLSEESAEFKAQLTRALTE